MRRKNVSKAAPMKTTLIGARPMSLGKRSSITSGKA